MRSQLHGAAEEGLDATDPRLRAMLAVAERAVTNGTMTSAARLGRQSDDLRATAAALTTQR